MTKLSQSNQSLFQEIGKGFWLFLTLFCLFLFSPAAQAYNILFYYNSSDVNGVVLRCATVLKNAGNQVTTIDVGGKNRNPANDNWGAPYDQVWDMRFIDRDKDECGSGSLLAADYFDSHWRDKAVSFLDHCGKLFVAGEHYQLTDRDEGLYQFLKEIQAVKSGYDSCPPSRRGNSTTDGGIFYPVHHGLGPRFFYGKDVGGIPLSYLNGTSFVDTEEDWQGDDGVDRSIVSGWTGGQLGGRIPTPACARGKLFLVWDATMWTVWTREVEAEAEKPAPIWEDSAWTPPDPDAADIKDRIYELQRAKAVTKQFFPAVAKWLGSRQDCPCTAAAVSPPVLTPTTVISVKPTAPLVIPGQAVSQLRPVPNLPPPGLSGSLSAPETIVFTTPPVNIRMLFKDGPGQYQLDVFDARGLHLRTIFNRQIVSEKETWTSWDGVDEAGRLMTIGTYVALFSKDGRPLKKIILSWIAP